MTLSSKPSKPLDKKTVAVLSEAERLLALDQPTEAMNLYNQVLAANDQQFDALVGCGRALLALRQFDFALAHFNFALGQQPQAAIAYHYRALAYHGAKHFEQALIDHQQALALNPNEISTYLNLANTLAEMDRFEEALEFYNGVIEMSPQYAIAYNNRGNLFLDQRMIEQALADYAQAAKLDPGQQKFRWNQSIMHILLGQYEQGWPLYEAGLGIPGFARGLRKHVPQAEWLGKQNVSGKRVLLYAEQGYGDTIQFCRYAKQVQALGAEVILEVQAPLVSLLQTINHDQANQTLPNQNQLNQNQPSTPARPEIKVVAQGSGFTEFDYHCPLMSLPMVFHTTVNTVPAPIPYLYANDLSSSPSFIPAPSPASRLRIGLVWSGSTTHKNDHRRSLALAALAPLLALPFEFHCLQQEVRPADAELLSTLPALTLHQSQLKTFADTANLIAQMDLVISVDTSVAHLAGAMGKALWVLLPFVPDYRWLLDRTDTPWYPQARLWRQPAVGDWQTVVNALTEQLQHFPAGLRHEPSQD